MSEPPFTERHAEKISKLKLVLIVVCLIAIPVSFYLNHRDFGTVNNRVTQIESPCLRYGPRSSKCEEAFEKAVLTINRPEACAILRKVRLEPLVCRGTHLRHEKGVMPHTPHHTATQQPSPPATGGAPQEGSTQGELPPVAEGPKPQPASAPESEPEPPQHPVAESIGGVTKSVCEVTGPLPVVCLP